MQNAQTNLLFRDDTLLGVCQGLGDDFGFNPIYLRVALAGLLYVNPVMTLAGYFGVGAVVLASRLLAPNPRRAQVATLPAPATATEAAPVQQPLPLAA